MDRNEEMDDELMQPCYACKKQIADGDYVIVKCLAKFQPMTGGVMHGISILEELEIVHEQCAED